MSIVCTSSQCLGGSRAYTVSLPLNFLFCWHFKLVHLWTVFKRMTRWLSSPKFSATFQSRPTMLSEIWMLPYSLFLCFPPLGPCVRLSRVYCCIYISFWAYDNFFVNGMDMTVFQPLWPCVRTTQLKGILLSCNFKTLGTFPCQANWNIYQCCLK